MMTIFENKAGERIIAIRWCWSYNEQFHSFLKRKSNNWKAIQSLSTEGYRILAIGGALFKGDGTQKSNKFFIWIHRLLTFYDPKEY
jgi:Ca2+-transporting ATPase